MEGGRVYDLRGVEENAVEMEVFVGDKGGIDGFWGCFFVSFGCNTIF